MAIAKPRQQLLLVKDLYREAEQAAARDDKFSTSKGILFFDLAVEQMLLTIITTLPTKVTMPKGELKWDQLWQTASDVMMEHGCSLPGKASLRNLHQDRNRVQHGGSIFHFTQVRRYIGPVQNMLVTIFQDAFGLDFENFREWDLVANESLRRWLQHSEDLLRNGDPVRCMAGCSIAHEYIIAAIREKTKIYPTHRTIGNRIESRLSGTLSREEIAALIEELTSLQETVSEQFDTLDGEIVTLGVGMPVMETRRFLQATKSFAVAHFGGGKIEIADFGATGGPERETEMAGYMLDYLSRIIYLAEEAHPNVLDGIKMNMPEQGF